MTAKKNSEEAVKSDALDIIEASLATKGGEPQLISLQGVEISVRRDFTGQEAMDYIAMFDPATMTMDFDKWVREQLAILSDSTDEALDEFVSKLMELKVAVTDRVLLKMGMIAGLRDAKGNFFPGQLS